MLVAQAHLSVDDVLLDQFFVHVALLLVSGGDQLELVARGDLHEAFRLLFESTYARSVDIQVFLRRL